MKPALLLACLALAVFPACGCPPPARISVPRDLPEAVQVAAARARDAWCAAPVGWCPELVDDVAEGWVMVGAGPHAAAAAYNDGAGMIEVAPWAAPLSADALTGVLTHEFGHYGIVNHVPASALMHARFATVLDIPTVVDAEAAAAWCKEQGC